MPPVRPRHLTRQRPMALGMPSSLSMSGSPLVARLWSEDFITDQAAPLTTPRTAEPGPGVFTIAGPSLLAISGGEVAGNAMNAGNNNPGIYHATGFSRVGGRTFKARVKNVSAFGSDANKTLSPGVFWAEGAGESNIANCEGIGYWVANTKFFVLDSITATTAFTLETCDADTYHTFAVILRSGGGAFHIIDGKLVFITRFSTDSNVHPDIFTIGTNRNTFGASYHGGGDLGYPWNTDFAICTNQLPGARAASDAFVHEADCHIEFTITTLPSSGNIIVKFRIVDANNYWQFLISSTGTVSLQEVVSGSATTRLTISSCQAADRMIAMMKGANIQLNRDRPAGGGIAQGTAYGVGLFPSQTTGQVNSLGTGGAISDLYTYPYTLSGTAMMGINAI